MASWSSKGAAQVRLGLTLAETCAEIRKLVDLAELTIPIESAGEIIEDLNEKVHKLKAINILTDTDRIVRGLEDDYDDVAP